MVRLLLFLVLCCSAQLVILSSSDFIKKKISEALKETEVVKNENKKLTEKLNYEKKVFYTELLHIKTTDQSLDSKILTEIDKLKHLQANMSSRYCEEMSLKRELQLEKLVLEQNQLSNRLLKQNLETLVLRKNVGDDRKCFDLQKQSKSDVILRSLTTSDDEDIVLSKIVLKRTTSILTYERARREELNLQLKDQSGEHTRMKKDLMQKLMSARVNLQLAKKSVEQLDAKFNQLGKKTNLMKSELLKLRLENTDQITETKTLEERLKTFSKDISCYNKLTNNLII